MPLPHYQHSICAHFTVVDRSGGSLFHHSSGHSIEIDDPLAGWQENSPDLSEPRQVLPLGGSMPVNLIVLKPRLFGEDSNSIGLSHFGWIADYCKSIGCAAPQATKAWWSSLRRFVHQQAVKKVTRRGSLDEGQREIYCFAGA